MRSLPAALLFLSILFGLSANVSAYSAPILFEAEAVIQSAPEKALSAAQRYLIQRRMIESTKTLHSNDKNRSVRTPLNTVHAYLIIAKAHSELGNHAPAWEALGKANTLIEKYNLKLAGLGAELIEAALLFGQEGKADEAERMISALLAKVPKDQHLPQSLKRVAFEAQLLSAIIVTTDETEEQSLLEFQQVASYLDSNPDLERKVRYQIALGKYYLTTKSYERALSELLSAYWLASENDFGIQIAQANLALASLYQPQGITDKALQHANQAAEFYEQFDISRGLSDAQTLLASIYCDLKRYNFALAHYFNTLDIENALGRYSRIANLHVAIATTYQRLKKFEHAEEYINNAIDVATEHKLDNALTKALIVKGELAMTKEKANVAIASLRDSLERAETSGDSELMLKSLSLLSKAHEEKGDYQQALYIERRYDSLAQRNLNQKQREEADSFRQRQRFIERQLQFEDMQRKQLTSEEVIVEQKKVNLFLMGSLAVLLLILILRHRAATSRRIALAELQKEFYTHPRSGLRNLRMLNDRLSNSLAKSNAHFEQWYLGEMIHEPLSDKLSFAMFEVPFLKVVYLQHGYRQGLELERKFGDYLNALIDKPARLYHFSDAMFIYIEPYSESASAPEKLANKIQGFIEDFVKKSALKDVDDRLRIGMADYPFLPRAYTTINDKELIDILLMATSAARQACKQESSSQWVHLSAIDSTPAACFAYNNVRKACLDGIHTGLIKVKSSAVSEINWQTVHESDKN